MSFVSSFFCRCGPFVCSRGPKIAGTELPGTEPKSGHVQLEIAGEKEDNALKNEIKRKLMETKCIKEYILHGD